MKVKRSEQACMTGLKRSRAAPAPTLGRPCIHRGLAVSTSHNTPASHTRLSHVSGPVGAQGGGLWRLCGGSLLRIPPSFGSMCAYLNRVAGSWLSVTAMIRVTGLKFLRGASPFTPTGGWGPQPQTPFFTKSHVFPTSYWVFDTAAYVKWYPHTCTASVQGNGVI